MAKPINVVHYLNQFFGGIGGEEKANTSPEIKAGAVGPGKALQQVLGAQGTIVATIVAGDNFVVEETSAAMKSVDMAIKQFKPDVIVAGPAFEAGRYGLACAEVCKAAQDRGIPAVTAMYPDNPGVLTHRKDIVCVPTGTSPTEMPAVLRRMAAIALKLGRRESLGTANTEGYLPRGLRRFAMRNRSGAERAADMLKARLENKTFVTEVYLQKYEVIKPPPPIADFSTATVALVTTGAVVPKGNPDKMPAVFATRYFKYSVQGLSELETDRWESVHAGFNTNYINTQDPNYALPLAAARELERDGVIKRVFPEFFSLPGVASAVKESKRFGAEMAQELKASGIDAVLLVAT